VTFRFCKHETVKIRLLSFVPLLVRVLTSRWRY